MPKTTLIENIDHIFTANFQGEELTDGYVVVNGNKIQEIGEGSYQGAGPDRIIDGSDKLLLPGFVNTHHHLYQTLFRNFKEVNNAKLFDWLSKLYERWKRLDREAIYTSTVIGTMELLLSGATTTTDHQYIYPADGNNFFEAQIEGTNRTGIRFHPTRGSMSLSQKDGGLPPESVVQDERQILEHSRKMIEKYHNPQDFAMVKVALAPCSPFSVSEEIMKETRDLAREMDVRLHTHLAETEDENEFCMEQVGCRPVEYMDRLGWLSDRVWFAHMVHLTEEEINRLCEAGVGMAHCPSSNMRLGSGIAPVTKMKETDINIGIAVDGSASNDTSNMVKELRQTLLLQRVQNGADAISPREVLKMATIGGAKALGREEEIGSIETGKAADLIMIDLDRLEYAGGLSDPVSAVIMCDTKGVDFNMVNGEIVVERGEFRDQKLLDFIPRQNEIAKRFWS